MDKGKAAYGRTGRALAATGARAWRPVAAALALALANGPALALGLGQIEVRSGPGEPLLAEIPIISNDPRELEQLQARLASPETFRRIGLQPPQGLVSGLQFTVALDARGNPVVRVTSAGPVQQPLVTFLVEVDWGQGRLVREYSALVGAPSSAAAVAATPVQAPVVAPPNTIVRTPARPPVVPEPIPEAIAEAPPVATPAPTAPQPPPPVAPAPRAVAPPMPRPAPPAPAQVAAAAAAAPAQVTVAAGQTLSGIVGRLDLGGASANQAMVALQQANPDAFIDGNINLLRAGAVLRVPSRDALAEVDRARANALVRAQVRQWREAQAPPPQPAIAAAATAPDAGESAAPAAAARSAAAPDARLEIVPPGEGGATGNTTSGLSAGGEGDMLRTQLQQTREELAARDAELAELRSRVEELEALGERQQQLIQLKDTELASVQQRLAGDAQEAGAAAAAPAAASASVPGEAETARAEPLPWLLGGGVLVVLAALAWLFTRRRRPPVAVQDRRGYDTAALAAGMGMGMGVGRGEDAVEGRTWDGGRSDAGAYDDAAHDDGTQDDGRDTGVDPAPRSAGAPRPGGSEGITDEVASGDRAGDRRAGDVRAGDVRAVAAPSFSTAVQPAPVAAPAPVEVADAPTWHAGKGAAAAAASASHDIGEAPDRASLSGGEGLELARAYLDLGDDDRARSLLREVLDGRDPAAREEAARLLRELG